MKTKTILAILAAVVIPLIAPAQQTPSLSQPAPAQAQPQPAPCPTAPQTPQQPKGFHFDIPKQLKQTINQQRQKIQDKTGTTFPSPEDLKQQKQQQPCATSITKPAVPAPATQPPAKPVYVCPPRATLLPNTTYCLLADRTVVDAIPVPPGLQTPAPPASAAPAPAQH